MFSFLHRLMAGTPSIDVAELDSLLKSRSVCLLDVREDNEFKAGHVPGAVNVPLKRLTERLPNLKNDKPYAVICQSGRRSERASGILLDAGFEGAVSVRGGTAAWASSGRPIVH